MRPYVNGPSDAVFAKKFRSSLVNTLHNVGSVPAGASAGTAVCVDCPAIGVCGLSAGAAAGAMAVF